MGDALDNRAAYPRIDNERRRLILGVGSESTVPRWPTGSGEEEDAVSYRLECDQQGTCDQGRTKGGERVVAQPIAYDSVDHEAALKYAVQHVKDQRAEVIEGGIITMSPMWDHESVIARIRRRLDARVEELDCLMGSGNLDLPGSPNWYVPDLAVVPLHLAMRSGALVPKQTLLIVEVTSESNAETDRMVKRKRYAQYGAPLYLLVDRQQRSWTLFADPHDLGFGTADGPHSYGTPIALPDPFGLTIDTSDF
jgi:Uma2 family endonuclease